MTNELAELLLQRVDIVYLTKGISIADVRYIHIIHNQKMHKGSKGRVKSKLASHMAHTNSIIIYTETFRVRRLSPLTSNSGGGGGDLQYISISAQLPVILFAPITYNNIIFVADMKGHCYHFLLNFNSYYNNTNL